MKTRAVVRALGMLALASAACVAGAQAPALPPGSITGVVSATTASGQTIQAANVLVHLWRTDTATAALRDSACAAWQVDRTAWTGASMEVESPSGMDLAGTPVGRDVNLLRALASMAQDTVRTDAHGGFEFRNVAVGAYTVEADVYANSKFLQWSRDAAVLPRMTVRADLDASVLSENQYCGVVRTASDTARGGRMYDVRDLDVPLRITVGSIDDIFHTLPLQALSKYAGPDYSVEYNIGKDGVPDVNSVTVRGPVTGEFASAFRSGLANIRFAPPLVHGQPVAVHNVMTFRMKVERVGAAHH